ncbi:MAG: DNA-3-methyladenine glycosylase family protein [Nitrospiraceae bacterium]
MMKQIDFLLSPVLPFRLDFTVWALRRRSNNAMDRWEEGAYQRTLAVEAIPVHVAVRQQGVALAVTATGVHLPSTAQADVTAALDRLLGLQVDLRKFYELSSQEARLHRLGQRFLGLKPPRFLSVFETLVNAISCQQFSLTVGITLLNRLSERYGPSSKDGRYAFPDPENLAEVEVEQLMRLGYSRNKGLAITNAARAVMDGKLDLDALATMDDARAVDMLTDLRGVGRWTAEYTLLRGLGRIHQFPGDDVGARKGLHRWLGLKRPLDYDYVRRVLRRWQPYGGLIYFHLLLDGLDRRGCLT